MSKKAKVDKSEKGPTKTIRKGCQPTQKAMTFGFQ